MRHMRATIQEPLLGVTTSVGDAVKHRKGDCMVPCFHEVLTQRRWVMIAANQLAPMYHEDSLARQGKSDGMHNLQVAATRCPVFQHASIALSL
mmetsp:Transcript_7142/g.22063  ORF Transcript_7142/g.22063 Transcript_7142/m.22063 type:complete len:93 (+) Transcript_7142:940-1218(+)